MPWPPTIPPATRANATALLDTHPADHNAISQALTDIVARFPVSTSPTVQVKQGGAANTAATVAATVSRSLWKKVDGWVVASVYWVASAAGTATPLWTTFPAGFAPLATPNLDMVLGSAFLYSTLDNVGVAYFSSQASNSGAFAFMVHGSGAIWSTALASGHTFVANLAYPAATP